MKDYIIRMWKDGSNRNLGIFSMKPVLTKHRCIPSGTTVVS